MANPDSFNGAATCSLRNEQSGRSRVTYTGVLQWGRNLFVAEWDLPSIRQNPPPSASMGPQLVRCGMPDQDIGNAITKLLASMGPQLVRCGMLQ